MSASAITDDGCEYFYPGEKCFQRLALLMRKKGGKWAAHYGGGYDHLLMIPFLGRIVSVILTGSRLYSIKFACGVELIDTFPQWLCSLAAVGKYVGMPKITHDRTKLAQLSQAELKEYNLRDCHIMKKGWEAAEDYCDSVGMKHRMTAGSAAIEALRVLEPSTWRSWKDNRLHWETLTGLENIAPGGFTADLVRGKVAGVHCYDLKSSYPSTYSDPAGMMAGIQEIKPNKAAWNDPLAVIRVRWFLDASRDGVTVAPGVDAATGLSAGYCQNWLTYDERMLLDTDVRVSRVTVDKAYGPQERLTDACKTFQEILFRWKEQGVFFAKVWINSLHGKFCERVAKDTWHTQKPKASFLGHINPPKQIAGVDMWRFQKLAVDDDGFAQPHYQPGNGSLVYGRARAHIIRLIRIVQRAGYLVFYVDTDSMFTDCPPDVMQRLIGDEYGSGLGQLNYEGGPFSGWIFGRKLYYLENEKGEKKIAAKGVPMKSLNRGQRVFGVFAERSGGRDVQADVFREIETKGFAKILRTGVTPFVMGAGPGTWDRFRMVRTLKPLSQSTREYDEKGIGHYVAGAI